MKPTLARAVRGQARLKVPVGWLPDSIGAAPGDWLLRYADGEYGVVRDDIFRQIYQPAPGEARWPPPL